jgi:hypothetical protein
LTARLGAGLLLALASAGALNWAYYVQHGAAARLPALSPRRPLHSLGLLFRSGRWLAGFVTGVGGWVLYVLALAFAPLSLVQAAAAGGIALLAVLAGGLSSWERLSVSVAVVGLLLLGLSLSGVPEPTGHGAVAAVAAWLAGSVALAALAAGALARVLQGGAGLGIAAGALYAAGDVGTKAAVAGGGRLGFVPAVLACHGLGFVALQLGFQRGGALATAGLASLWTNALPIAAGSVLFGETVPDGLRGLARVAAFACVVFGAAGFARLKPGESFRPEPLTDQSIKVL